jgi:hypothetical protein
LDLKTAATKAKVALYRRVYALTSETNKQYKNVENYALETLGDDEKATPDALLAFLKELFDVITEDRRETVDKFHEIVLARKAAAPALAAPEEQSNTVLLTDESGSDTAAGETSVSDLAKNYAV